MDLKNVFEDLEPLGYRKLATHGKDICVIYVCELFKRTL